MQLRLKDIDGQVPGSGSIGSSSIQDHEDGAFIDLKELFVDGNVALRHCIASAVPTKEFIGGEYFLDCKYSLTYCK